MHVSGGHAKRTAALRRHAHKALHSLEVEDIHVRECDVAFGAFVDRDVSVIPVQ